MSEPKLIDANALNERFDKRIKWLRLDMHDQYSLGLYHGAVTDKDLINEMPIVDAADCIRYMPAADVTTVRNGRCKKSDGKDEWYTYYYTCVECGANMMVADSDYHDVSPNYCPNCGAKMDLKD